MRYAIVSDIHGNIHAWNAVYQDILNVGVDELVCLGDLVGYGPEPGRVIESCYANVHHFVLGNHDAAVCGKMKLKRFNPDSRHIIEWTKQSLDRSGTRFLSDLPLVVSGENAIFTHASVVEPANFDYLYQPQDCLPSWGACQEQAIFIGHTHISGIHMIGEMGIPQWLPPQDLRFTRDIRYVINVGSVGQPRDGDTRACYLIYDTDRQSIQYRRVPYNLGEYFAALRHLDFPVHPCMIEGSAGQTDFAGGYQSMEMPRVMGTGGKVKPLGAAMVEERAKPILSKTKFKSRRVAPPRGAGVSGRHPSTTGRQSAVTGRHAAARTGGHAPVRGGRNGGDVSGEYHRDAVSRTGAYRAPVRRSGGSNTIILTLFGAILLVGVLGALLIIANNISRPREDYYKKPAVQQPDPRKRGTTFSITRETRVKRAPVKVIPRTTAPKPAGPARLGGGSGSASGYVAGTDLLLGDADKDGEDPAEW